MCYGSVFLIIITTEIHRQWNRLCGNAGLTTGPNYNIGYKLHIKHAHQFFSSVNLAYRGSHLRTPCTKQSSVAEIYNCVAWVSNLTQVATHRVVRILCLLLISQYQDVGTAIGSAPMQSMSNIGTAIHNSMVNFDDEHDNTWCVQYGLSS